MVSPRSLTRGWIIVLLLCVLLVAAMLLFQWSTLLHVSGTGHSLAATMVEYAILL